MTRATVSLLVLIVLPSWAIISRRSNALESAAPPQSKSDTAMDIKRAVDIALDAVKERRVSWTKGCDIRIRRGDGDWRVYLEPIPMGPGLDVMVTVHADGSATIAPGY